MKIMTNILLLVLVSLVTVNAHANAHDNFSVQKNIVFKTVKGRDIKLDLYLPTMSKNDQHPLLIWVHGGAWKRGTKDDIPTKNPLLLNSVINAGYALASVDYRLSGEAIFPAPVSDINDAINYLHENAVQYQILADEVVVMGRSAGGHLAGLIGATNAYDDIDFYVKPLYEVAAVVSFFGPTDLISLGNKPARTSAQKSNNKTSDNPSKQSSVARFLGDHPQNVPDLAKQASITTYINQNTPPFIMFHGTLDRQVPLSQSTMLQKLLDQHNVDNQLYIEEGVGHSAPVFDTDKYVPYIINFLELQYPHRKN